MKKQFVYFLVAALSVLASVDASAQKGYRYSVIPGSNNKYAIPYKEIKAVAYASTINVIPTQEETTYNIGQLTGSLTMTSSVSVCYTGDRMTCLFSADGSDRVVTFSTGFSSNGTLTILANTSTEVGFLFNGTAWDEITRQTAPTLSVTTLTVTGLITATGGVTTLSNKGYAYTGTLTVSGAGTPQALNQMAGTVTMTGVGDIAADATANVVINNNLVTAGTVGLVVMQTTTAAAGSTPRIEAVTYGAGTITIAIRNSDPATATGVCNYTFSFILFKL